MYRNIYVLIKQPKTDKPILNRRKRTKLNVEKRNEKQYVKLL